MTELPDPAETIEPLPANIDNADVAAELAAQLRADAVTFHQQCQMLAGRWAFVQRLGAEVVGAETFAGYEYLATAPLIYFGRVAQPEPWDFADALVPARRGQA
jgi:hypothetical protein